MFMKLFALPWLIVALGLIAHRPYHYEHGIVKHYSPGLMERVAAKRGLTLPRGYAGFVSVPDCSLIGKTVWASVNYGPWERHLVADCSAPQDVARHRREGLVLEVSYREAAMAGFAWDGYRGEGKAPATVWRP